MGEDEYQQARKSIGESGHCYGFRLEELAQEIIQREKSCKACQEEKNKKEEEWLKINRNLP